MNEIFQDSVNEIFQDSSTEGFYGGVHIVGIRFPGAGRFEFWEVYTSCLWVLDQEGIQGGLSGVLWLGLFIVFFPEVVSEFESTEECFQVIFYVLDIGFTWGGAEWQTSE